MYNIGNGVFRLLMSICVNAVLEQKVVFLKEKKENSANSGSYLFLDMKYYAISRNVVICKL